MTPHQVREARHSLGLELSEMALMLGYFGAQMKSQMRDLETGRRELREPQRRLIQAYLEGYRPEDWPRFSAVPFGSLGQE